MSIISSITKGKVKEFTTSTPCNKSVFSESSYMMWGYGLEKLVKTLNEVPTKLTRVVSAVRDQKQ